MSRKRDTRLTVDDARHRRSVILVYLVSALLFGALLWVELARIDRASMAAARERGAALFRLIEITRDWNARHDGVYVPVTPDTRPNPHLSHPRRDIVTVEGRALTMVNPAFMTRQIAELAERAEGVRLHITSLRPIRPGNDPDPWETASLTAFERGAPEVMSLLREDGRPIHRYMAPLRMTEPCLQCHGRYGYKLGDIRGGISVTMPAESLLVLRDAQRVRTAGLFLAAALLAAGLIHYMLIVNRRHMRAIARMNADQEKLIARRTGELAASEARYRAIFDSTAEGIMLLDAEARIQHINPAFTAITGYQAGEVQGHGVEMLGAGRHGQGFFDDIRRALLGTGYWQGEIWNRRKSGDAYVQWMSITRASLPGEESAYVATLTDITQRKEVEQRMHFRANHDALTMLPNRALFADRLDAAIAAWHRHQRPFAVLFIDLDQFKAVNDRLGHPAGDALLVEAGARIASCLRESDTVARFGGDEFAVLLTEIEARAAVEDIAQRICVKLAAGFALPQGEAQVAASIGVAIAPEHGTDAELLQQHADEALYAAKRAGRNGWRVYAQDSDGGTPS